MTSALEDISEAVKFELESIVLSQAFDLYINYGDWEDVLEDFNNTRLRIDVVPFNFNGVLSNRTAHRYTCVTSVLLRKPIAKEERENGRVKKDVIHQLVSDLQTVHEFFAPSQPNQTGRKLSQVPTANWQPESDIMAAYSRKLLKSPGQYSGWIKVVHSVLKTLGS